MLSQNQLKFLRSLAVKKYRIQEGLFLVEGVKMVAELLLQSRLDISAVYGLDSWARENATLIQSHSEKFQVVSEMDMGKISNLSTPNQVLAVVKIPSNPCDFNLCTTDICIYLDGIQDPGNIGSILRIADWFGFPAVFCSPDCADVFSPKVVQASMGAIFRVQSWEIELSALLANRQQVVVAGAVLNGTPVFEMDLPATGLLVIGNEGRGISTDIEALLTHRISIVRHPNGGAESLNAAVAAGILAAAFRR